VRIADPYRYLEKLKSTETRAWLKAEGDYAAAQLARIPRRGETARRIEALADASGDVVRGVMRRPGRAHLLPEG